MTLCYDDHKRPIQLGNSFGSGGEGTVYSVVGDPSRCAKIYKNNDICDPKVQARNEKLRVMSAHPIKFKTKVAWPQTLLFDNQSTLIGFLMNHLGKGQTKLFDAIYHPTGVRWSDLVNVAANLSVVIAELHDKDIVVGDLNESNVMVDKHGVISVVDCDSMQIKDPRTGIILPCPVGKDDFRAPEIFIHKASYSIYSDLFALGILICRLIMNKAHPFFCGPNSKFVDNIIRNETFLKDPTLAHPCTVSKDILPLKIKKLLMTCVVDGHSQPHTRPAAKEWIRELRKLSGEIKQCPQSPNHNYSQHLNQCPWCAYYQQHGLDIFNPGRSPSQTFSGQSFQPTMSSQIPLSTQTQWTSHATISSGVSPSGTVPKVQQVPSPQPVTYTPIATPRYIPKALLFLAIAVVLVTVLMVAASYLHKSELTPDSTRPHYPVTLSNHYQGMLSINGKPAQWVTLSLSTGSGKDQFVCQLNSTSFTATRYAYVDQEKMLLILDDKHYFQILEQNFKTLLKAKGDIDGELHTR